MTVTSFNVPDLPFADAAAAQQQGVERQTQGQRPQLQQQQQAQAWLQEQFTGEGKNVFVPRGALRPVEGFLPLGVSFSESKPR